MRSALLLLAASTALAAPAAAREPAVAGQFYPAGAGELARAVDGYLAAYPDVKKPAGEVLAVIVPHAGYEYSGRLAGLAYRYVADSYDTVVVLATGHTEPVKGAALLASDFYVTPLGKVPPDRKLAAALVKADPLFEDKPSAHVREHAIEVQLPFLQRRLKKPFKLLAATMNTQDLDAARTVGARLAAALKGKKALIVVSADLSHYPSRADAAAADGAVRLAVESLDPALLWSASRFILQKRIPGLDTCACGEAAMIAGMEAARLLGAKSFTTLALSDSYAENPRPGPDRVVGYLSGVFTRAGEPRDLALSAGQKAALLAEARRTLERHFAGEPQPAGLEADPRLNLPGAAFVTLKKGGLLRGCVGTVVPAMTLMDAVRYGAYSAAFRDGRFPRLAREELEAISIEVSVLSALKEASAREITPHVHGVVVERGGKSGLFLPQVWAQIPEKEDFMGEVCSQKAGLPRDCWKQPGTRIYTFTDDAVEEERK